MKQLRSKRVLVGAGAVTLAGLVMAGIGADRELMALVAVGGVMMLIGIVLGFLANRCPACGGFLRTNHGRLCPYCGKSLRKWHE